MRIYFAAPLFNAAEQRFNARLTWQLEERNHRVFLPQRDGLEMATVDPDDPGAVAEMRRRVFQLDTSEVMAADLVVAVLDGRVPDEGVCVEIGVAWATRRARGGASPAIVGLKTDARAWLPGDPVNPMVSEALDHLFSDETALLRWVASLEDADGHDDTGDPHDHDA
jgi:nucleoside 2-deoxyribosyltransferase